tara:strand:- start:1298 stop:1489 length:192 start_codon:yes stop_codon:yes gene_type:complete
VSPIIKNTSILFIMPDKANLILNLFLLDNEGSIETRTIISKTNKLSKIVYFINVYVENNLLYY